MFKPYLLLAAALPLALMVAAPVVSAQSFLVDFSDNVGTTPGNWNNSNATDGYTVFNMVDTTGLASAIDMNFVTGVSENGPFGVTAAPSPFNVETAYNDALFTSGTTITFRFSSLDTNATYTLEFFGSRDSTGTRITDYTVSTTETAGDGTTVSLTTSGLDVGGTGVNHNIANTAVVSTFAPNVSGEIFVDIDIQSGAFGYLNAMQLTAIPEPQAYVAIIGVFSLGFLFLRRRAL